MPATRRIAVEVDYFDQTGGVRFDGVSLLRGHHPLQVIGN